MTLLVASYFKHANNATWSYRTYIYTHSKACSSERAFFVLARAGAHVLCHGASFLGVSLAKARSETGGKLIINLPG